MTILFPSPGALLVLFLWAANGSAHAQKHRVSFTTDEEVPAKWTRPMDVGAAVQVPTAVDAQLALLHGQGFLEARLDTCLDVDHVSTCHLLLGRPYRWARLSGAGIPAEIASEARFREKLYSGRPITPRQVQRLFDDLLRYSEDNGHPFARVWLDSLHGESDGLHATLRLDRGPLVKFDSVVVKGSAVTNMRYLTAHIGIRPGDPYNESLVLAVERRIRELPFVSQRQRPHVQFTPENTKLFLFLDAKKASSINGILGVQPDAVTGEVRVTGDLDLRLRNALKRGEGIALNWRSLADQTQDLRVGGDLPFAFNTPFGLDGNLRLFKRDTTFLEVVARGGLSYMMARGDRVTLFINSKSNSRLGSNLVAAPGLADVKLLSYGIGVQRERLDYRFNPRQGHALRAEASAGRKRTSTATLAPGEARGELRTLQYDLEGEAVAHLPLARRSTFRFVARGGWMVNDDLYRNELHRVGGLRTLRGVDEQSIICSAYAVGTVEYRFVYEENANFFLFVDQGWWEDASADAYRKDEPLGFGAGTTFETKAGLFSITYALGREFGNPIALRGGKVHFGFVALF
ncbi:MAG: BamA/TamA family outer membrane protein [Flavobacteriales bacterium]|nr:BamA/TamA family outer membrane protein [Flavobacteriales bacterium]